MRPRSCVSTSSSAPGRDLPRLRAMTMQSTRNLVLTPHEGETKRRAENYLACEPMPDRSLEGRHMRMMLSIALLLLGTLPIFAQSRRAMICREFTSIGLRPSDVENEWKTENIAKGTFSITFNREYVNLISVGKSDLYECQKIVYRSERRRGLNTIKCQNGTNFLTLDLVKLTFIKSQMDPEDESEVGFSYGSCRLI